MDDGPWPAYHWDSALTTEHHIRVEDCVMGPIDLARSEVFVGSGTMSSTEAEVR
jgi:hypothetical protein